MSRYPRPVQRTERREYHQGPTSSGRLEEQRQGEEDWLQNNINQNRYPDPLVGPLVGPLYDQYNHSYSYDNYNNYNNYNNYSRNHRMSINHDDINRSMSAGTNKEIQYIE